MRSCEVYYLGFAMMTSVSLDFRRKCLADCLGHGAQDSFFKWVGSRGQEHPRPLTFMWFFHEFF